MTLRTSIMHVGSLVLAALLAGPEAAQAQTRLTLADALARAADHSELLVAARAGERRAAAGEQRAFSARLPQIDFSGGYSRTLASEFSGAFESTAPPCAPLDVDPTAPIDDRVAELERAAGCGALGPSFNFADLPFGQRNIYNLGFSFSQAVYSGGRISGEQRQAEALGRIAALTTSATEAQLQLEVAQAFYDAALADRLLTIAQSVFDQAAATYDQTRLAYEAGRQPEFELLRAQVNRDNQRPTVIRRQAERDVAYLRLRRLLEIPEREPILLDVDLESPNLPPPAPFADELARANEVNEAGRLAIDQAEAVVAAREAAVNVARAARLPTVSLVSSYAGVGYPRDGVFPSAGDFRTNWSAGMSVRMPVFNGWRLAAEERAARADLEQAQAELQRTRELSVLDYATAQQELTSAEAVWEASAGTVQQAQRAYEIAELRNREGLSTQLELADSRLSLEIAQANRAQAARDLQVARARVALLPDLPMVPR
jgi:outer membrane protein TolC